MAVISGNKEINDPVKIKKGDKIKPGNSPGILTFNSPVHLLSGGTLYIEIDGPTLGSGAGHYSQIYGPLVSSTLTIDAGAILVLSLRDITNSNNNYSPNIGTSFIIANFVGGITGQFTVIKQPVAGLLSNSSFNISYTSTQIIATVTTYTAPEVSGNLGRISGPLLKSNLLRNGSNLAVETNLLYLDVNNKRVGINTSSPQYDLDVNGYFRATNIRANGTLTVSPYLTIGGNSITTSSNTLNLVTGTGGVVYQNKINVGNMQFSGNTITSSSNLELTPTGTTQIYSNTKVWGDLNVLGDINALTDVTISGNIILANQGSGSINFAAGIASDILPAINNQYSLGDANYYWSNVYGYNLYAGSLLLTNNSISPVTSNTDLVLSTNGTGAVSVSGLSINNYTISSASDITLSPSAGNSVIINSTASLKIPVGNSIARPNPASTGMIRFNTDYNQYEGYDGSNWTSLVGVYSTDRTTKITGETSPGANDNVITFTVSGSNVADLNSTRLKINALNVGNFTLSADTIQAGLNRNLYVSSNGTGSIFLDSLKIKNSTITNTLNNGVTTFTNPGGGYVKIDGTYGFVMPVGTEGNKITDISNPIGLTRYNTDTNRSELWNGHSWVSIAGAGAGVTSIDADLTAVLTVFSFG